MSEYSSKKGGSMIREYGEALLTAVILAVIIRTFVLQAYTIPSGSMLQTVQIGDYVLVNKFVYGVKIPFTDKYLFRGSDPQIGDIIVFKYPKDPDTDFIKRVVGLPGDVVEMRNKQFYRNGEPVKEDYIQQLYPNVIGRLDNVGPFTVPEDSYFVMGDNRDNSDDSRVPTFTARPGASTGRGMPTPIRRASAVWANSFSSAFSPECFPVTAFFRRDGCFFPSGTFRF